MRKALEPPALPCVEATGFRWRRHPNPKVEYHVYRRVEKDREAERRIAIKALGDTTFTDPQYTRTAFFTQYIVYYDVRAYYKTEATHAAAQWYNQTGDAPVVLPKRAEEDSLLADGTPVPQGLIRPDAELAAYPNPSKGQVTVYYELAETGPVALRVYDALGRLVRTLAEGERGIGSQAAVWDGRDGSGMEAGSGVYFVRLESGGTVRTVTVSRVK